MKYVPRASTERFHGLLKTFPAVVVYGPRQCGKSTFVRHVLPDYEYFDLERPRDFALLSQDPEGFLETHPSGVVIDESQRLPTLFPVLRHVLDRSPHKGRFVLLGSASPALMRSASETLAGRVALMELTPFRALELPARRRAQAEFWGGFPGVHALTSTRARLDWLDAYVSTFLERDLPMLGLSLDPVRIRLLWTMLTHVHGSLLNVSDLARSLAVSSHTVDHHLDVLESTFMIRRLRPFHANLQKRLTKSPKLYLRDVGLLHFLAGLRAPSELPTWPKRGASFEGLVIEELAGLAARQLVRPELSFFRTQAGAEVDLLVTNGRQTLPIEIKLGSHIDLRALAGLKSCMHDLHLKRGWVVTGGGERIKLSREIELIPWTEIISGSVDLEL